MLTSVMSLEAAAADMCREGCLTEEEQSRARAKVPTERLTTRNWSICRSVSACRGVQVRVSRSCSLRVSASRSANVSATGAMLSAWYLLPTRISPTNNNNLAYFFPPKLFDNLEVTMGRTFFILHRKGIEYEVMSLSDVWYDRLKYKIIIWQTALGWHW